MSQETNQSCAAVISSSLGWLGIVWRGCRVARLSLGHPTRKDAVAAIGDRVPLVAPDGCPAPDLVSRLQQYADGHPDDFSDIAVDTTHLTQFGKRVTKACRAIPYGRTASYAALAAEAGSPRAARAVGQCMANNRVPLIVPCHRVVGAAGRLGGFSAPGGVSLKRRLLEMESRSSQ